MQTFPFHEHHRYVSKLNVDQIIGRLSKKLAETDPTDNYLLKGKVEGFTFRFHMVIALGSRNSFNPICYGKVVPCDNKETVVQINMRIAYPVYLLWIIIFSMTVFGHITLTYGSYLTNGIMGVLFATVVMAIFYGALYFFYRFGFKRSTNNTIAFLVSYFDLKPIGEEMPGSINPND